MITRVWHGRTRKDDAERYREYVTATGVRDYLSTGGNMGVEIWQRDEQDVTHIWTVTHWQDLDSLRAFAGNDVEKARYYPEDASHLLEREQNVIHCRTFTFSRTRITDYLRQIEQLCAGGSWNNESFMEKLKSVDEATAFQQPLPGKHSVAEIVWHCTYWRTVLIKRMEGDEEFRQRTVEEQNFLPLETLRARGWTKLLDEFAEAQHQLTSLLSSKTDTFLEEKCPSGDTFAYMVEGIIHHDVYHLGQIGLVIAMLRGI